MVSRPAPWSQTNVTKKAMDAHLRKWADYLGLGSWHVAYAPEDPDEDKHAADSHSFPPTEMAAIRLSPCPVSQVDRLVVHELLHVLNARLEDTFEKAVSDRGSEAKALLEGLWKSEMERVIEKLVDCLTEVPREGLPQEGAVWRSAFPAR